MQDIDSKELDRRIETFLTMKHQEFPELGLRPQEPEEKVHTASEVFADLVAGMNWEFGR